MDFLITVRSKTYKVGSKNIKEFYISEFGVCFELRKKKGFLTSLNLTVIDLKGHCFAGRRNRGTFHYGVKS